MTVAEAKVRAEQELGERAFLMFWDRRVYVVGQMFVRSALSLASFGGVGRTIEEAMVDLEEMRRRPASVFTPPRGQLRLVA